MRSPYWFFVGAVFVALMLASPTDAQTLRSQVLKCDGHDKILEFYRKNFGEVPQAMGLIGARLVAELLIAADGNWTWITTDTNGLTCVLASGDGWTQTAAPLPGPMTQAGHLQGGAPQGTVYALCYDERTALEIAPLSENEFKFGVLRTDGCFRLLEPAPAWMTRVASCVVNADGLDVCVVEIHDSKNVEAYTWIVGTEAEIAPLMNNWGR